MAISVRIRFEVLKRDHFTCRYCGRTSPEVVMEVDHITPVCEGGGDDPINLAASCWECNRGKSGVSLSQTLTGEDPHDRAVMLLEQERQMREYNEVLRVVNERVDAEFDALKSFWSKYINPSDSTWLRNALRTYPSEMIYRAMQIAITARKTSGFAYVNAVLKNSAV